jgi:signal transduction histidine kinase
VVKYLRKPRSLFGKLMVSHLLVVALSLIIVGLFLIYLIENYFFSARELEVVGQARDAAYLLGEDLVEEDMEAVRKTAETLAFSMDAKIRVINYNHILIYTFEPETEANGDYVEPIEGLGLEDREIEHIFRGNMLTKKVYGPVLQRIMVAAPIFMDDYAHEPGVNYSAEKPLVVGAVTISVPLKGIEETIAQISRLTLYSGIIGVIIAGVFAFSLSKNLVRPLQKINRAALDMAAGNFRCKINEESEDEIGGLIRTFNYSVEQVEKNLEEQKRLDKLRRNLVANVSHELKAPLASVRGYSELMLDGLIDESEKEKYLKVILDNSIHLSKLVDDLMTLSYLESGQLSLEQEEISVDNLANCSLESVFPRGEAKNIKLSLEIQHSLPTLKGDQRRLHEVLVNLLENAITFTPEGREIRLIVYQKSSQLVMEVQDTGCGIDDDELQNIFDRFYKVDKSRRRSAKGSGLGLAISKQLVELHKGKIEVESCPGKGSIFRVLLPI